MSTIKSICVYCASGPGNNPEFMDAAKKFGRILGENRIRLVYGGGSVGLMGALAESVIEHGGAVTGVIPDFLVNREHMLLSVQERLITRDMHERKWVMFERADAFVALPGGVGTLEELVEQLTWAQLGRHKKPILRSCRSCSRRHVPLRKRTRKWRGSQPSACSETRHPRATPASYSCALRKVTASTRLPSGSRMKAA
jgi:uncharacterized protein (TIGR00730 family)